MSGETGFGIWITGIPASGKTSIAKMLIDKLGAAGISVVALESDEMRKILTPHPTYDDEERDRFYRSLALIGELITRGGVNVVFDATANKRAYRDFARSVIPKFIEAHVECPVEICMKRDPKGIYARAASGAAMNVPGVQAAYEPPLRPELTLDGRADPAGNADTIIHYLKLLLYI